MTEDKEFLRVENLKMYFPVTKGVFNKPVGTVKAVDGVSQFRDYDSQGSHLRRRKASWRKGNRKQGQRIAVYRRS